MESSNIDDSEVPDGVDTSSSGTVEQDYGNDEKTEMSFEELGDVDEGPVVKKGFSKHLPQGSFGGLQQSEANPFAFERLVVPTSEPFRGRKGVC